MDAALTALLNQQITKPGYLIEVNYSPVLRYSTRGDQTWQGHLFVAGFVNKYTPSQSLSILNTEFALSQLVLAQGATDIALKIWQFYGDVASPDVTVVQFDGFIDGAPVIGATVDFSLYDESDVGVTSPRMPITARNGFNVLPAPGLRVQWGQSTIILKPTYGDTPIEPEGAALPRKPIKWGGKRG